MLQSTVPFQMLSIALPYSVTASLRRRHAPFFTSALCQ